MQIKGLYEKYINTHAEDTNSLRLLAEQLEQNDQDIASRKNFVGHVTASAFVINKFTRQVLLLQHKSLGKLLQPGGHIDKEDDSPLGATLREIEEETGLKPDELVLRPVLRNHPTVPLHIDSHYIPENPRKSEPGHYHHDFRYLYITEKSDINVDLNESNGFQWVDWEVFADDPHFAVVVDRIEGLLEPNPRDFFRSIADNQGKEISVIAVSHIIPSSDSYILSLQENFNLIGIIPKPNSINKRTEALLTDKGVPILSQFTRKNITSNPDELSDYLDKYDNVCMVDIGGYFSESITSIRKKLGKKLLGVVEDTENGHQKYEKNMPDNLRVISVARSPLKSFEDQLVGNGVAHAAETVLRDLNTLITYKSCGIIGYGKIGRGIFQYLQQRGVQPHVCEIDSMRAIQASCDGAKVTSMNHLLQNSDVVFCATGSQAIDILKLRDLKRGAFLASVTSSDDEFDLRFINGEYSKDKITKDITRYSKRGHHFHLINDGNAVNFLYSAAVDKYIYLVQGELVASIGRLFKERKEVLKNKTLLTSSQESQSMIADAWLDYVLKDGVVL